MARFASRSNASTRREHNFVLALSKRGFVEFPRLLTDYALELHLDYSLLGRLVMLMAALKAVDGVADSEFFVSARTHPITYNDVMKLLPDLAAEELIKYEESNEEPGVWISFSPLYARLYSVWAQDVAYRQAHPGRASEAERRQHQLQEYAPVLRQVQQRLGRALNDREVDDLIDWAVTYGFEPGVIQAVIEEALARNKTHWRYIRAVANGWHDAGVRTEADLAAARAEHRQASAIYLKVRRRLNLDRRLTAAEQELIDKWAQQWGFPEETILKACDATVSTKEPTFAYIDRVLVAWKEKGLYSLKAVEDEIAAFHRQRTESAPRTPRRGGARPLARNFQLSVSDQDEAYYERIIED